MTTEKKSINIERMQERILQINEIGYDKATGGITRLGYTQEERAAHLLVRSWFADEERVKIIEDAAGNTILRMEGQGSKPAMAIGSHLDTVTNGGKYDGQAGVVTGLEVLSQLLENNIQLRYPFEVIIFANEEASRFGVSTVGSKAMAGMLKSSGLEHYVDINAVTVKQAIKSSGIDVERFDESERSAEEIGLFLELHIEQGTVLEEIRSTVGLVTSIAKPYRLKVKFFGQASHSGTTPMEKRRNALLPASRFISLLDSKAQGMETSPLVASVTMAHVEPNNINVIPSAVELGVDIRSYIPGEAKQFVTEFLQHWSEEWELHWESLGYRMETTPLVQDEPILLNSAITDWLETLCKQLDLKYLKMPSGAGHDAMNIASRFPAALVFVPCPDGISHHPLEGINEEAWKQATHLFLEAILTKQAFCENEPAV